MFSRLVSLIPRHLRPAVTTDLPELLARVLAADALEDLSTTGVLVHERAHRVDTAIDDDVQAFLDAGVFGDLAGGKLLRHDCEKIS